MNRPRPPVAPPSPRRLPKQRRSREIVEAILEATRRLLDERGPARLTTNHIADLAGISIGSLYRYFPDKDAILAAVYAEDTRREADALAGQAWLVESRSLPEALLELIDYQLERHRRLVERGGDFYQDCHHAFSLSREIGADDVTTRIRDVLARHRGTVRVADLDQAAYLLVRGLSAIVRRTTEECPARLDDEAFRRELSDLVLLYVTGRASSGAEG